MDRVFKSEGLDNKLKLYFPATKFNSSKSIPAQSAPASTSTARFKPQPLIRLAKYFDSTFHYFENINFIGSQMYDHRSESDFRKAFKLMHAEIRDVFEACNDIDRERCCLFCLYVIGILACMREMEVIDAAAVASHREYEDFFNILNDSFKPTENILLYEKKWIKNSDGTEVETIQQVEASKTAAFEYFDRIATLFSFS